MHTHYSMFGFLDSPQYVLYHVISISWVKSNTSIRFEVFLYTTKKTLFYIFFPFCGRLTDGYERYF